MIGDLLAEIFGEAVFVFLACSALFNIALACKWRWPLQWFIVSFVALFVSRILFGAQVM